MRENVWKRAKKCEKSAETILPFSCCPLVFLWFKTSFYAQYVWTLLARRTVEMNGGSSTSYLACAPCVPLFCSLFNRGGNIRRPTMELFCCQKITAISRLLPLEFWPWFDQFWPVLTSFAGQTWPIFTHSDLFAGRTWPIFTYFDLFRFTIRLHGRDT